MARSVNKAILLGNLGKDAELSYTPSNQPVSKFTLATNRRYKDKTGEWQEQTEWHNIVLWGKSAESLTQYLTKGQKVYVEGRIQTRSWEGRDGAKHYTTEIIADQVVFAGGGRGAGDEGGSSARPQARPAAAQAQPAGPSPDEGFSPEITDDDIPF